ncbi:carboxypeptidase-like regulatory domain-containing protein [Ferruginibacter albus]|uniref:carboxypeptidase-like regulatory domain-containing protein n=1 Tax=Ferruginibacter albus TaxID=2875540 RepID=UPI001CC37496|nr:carboxypeptidase-like regulatory domain-containing protein [Ferruginibacter albus]UAY52646.1 carboxypeptidase-like regulatory domain-containing protein [Ferruginibacter albus]
MIQKKTKLTLILLFTSILCLHLLTRCSKDAGSTFSVSGTVLNEAGTGIANATVKISGETVQTGNDGSFKISGLSHADIYKVEVNADGFFTGYKNVDNVDGTDLFTEIKLLTKNDLGTIMPSGGQAGNKGLRVIAPAGAFKSNDGQVYNGKVYVAARYVQGNDVNLSDLMPGGDFMANDENGNEGAMLSYGFVATEFKDENGNKLVASPDVKVGVTIPAGVNDPVSNGAKSWGYDSQLGKWTNGTGITQTNDEYFYPATTLFQNIDKCTLDFGTIEGQVLCTDNKPVPNITVRIKSTNYNNEYVVKTNANGKYRVKVAVKDGAVIFNYKVSAGGSIVDVNNIPVKGSATAPIIVTADCNAGAGDNGLGNFTVDGNNFSGPCSSTPDVSACSGIDVGIFTISGSSFIIYNMPQASSGSFSFTDAYQSVGGCDLYGLTTLSTGPVQYGTKNGTVTKTGVRSFTFSCTVYDPLTDATYNAGGSGTY